MQYSDVDGYQSAKAEHDGAITAARAAKDELAEMKAELAWRDKVDGFKQTASDIVTRQNAVEAAKAKAKADFPHAPEVVYAGLTDPEAITAAAEAAHKAIAAALPVTPPPPPGQNWPGGPAGKSAGAPVTHKWDDPTEWNTQMEKIQTMNKVSQGIDNPEFKKMQDYVLDKIIGDPLRKGAQNV